MKLTCAQESLDISADIMIQEFLSQQQSEMLHVEVKLHFAVQPKIKY